MPIGVIINCASVLIGGLLGSTLGKFIPERLTKSLPIVFGACSIAMGITYIAKTRTMPAVILAVILGAILGELIFMERSVLKGINKALRVLPSGLTASFAADRDAQTARLVNILVLFCVSGTGIFGAIESGMSGDHTVLITKSLLDFFTATTFAIVLGPMVALICLPQAIVLLILFFGGSAIYPLTSEVMRADFTACGGILMLVTGLRICEIKSFPIVNMIPAMAFVMPVSHLWTSYIVPMIR